jgi:hypothetical protein
LQDDVLAISDTVGKWFTTHQMSLVLVAMFKTLEVADGKSQKLSKKF